MNQLPTTTADQVRPAAASTTQTAPDTQRAPATADDRILPATRWVAALVIPFLVAAFVILYGMPTETERLFAWKLQPTMSAMMLAAAYAGGIWFFAGTLFGTRWHRVKSGLLPVTTFATFLGIATVLHWGRFNHQHVSFFAWAGLYFTTPAIVFAVWWINRRRDPLQPEADDALIPRPARIVVAAVGVLTLAIATLLLIAPTLLIGTWPWKLTPLSARVMAALFALPGVVGIGIAADTRWSAARLTLQAQCFSILLILLALARARDELDWTRAPAWFFGGGLAAMAALIVALYLMMEGRRARALATRRPTG